MTQQHPISISSILDLRLPKAGNTKLVAVDGHGGAGKSTLADLLAQALYAEVVHTDNFASWDNPIHWWPNLIERVLQPIAAGAQTLNYPRSSWWPDHEPEPVLDQLVTPVVILEGVSALRQEFRHYLTLGVFISTPLEVCLQRGIERDANLAPHDEVKRLWEQYYSDEERHFARDDPESYADVVLDGTLPFEGQLDLRSLS